MIEKDLIAIGLVFLILFLSMFFYDPDADDFGDSD